MLVDRIKHYMNRLIRGKFYLIHKDSSVEISKSVIVSHPYNISIGDGSYVNGNSYLLAGENSKINIGSNCLISYNVHIRTSTHTYIDKNTHIKDQGHIEQDIVIGNDVWIGFGVQIMGGIIIGDGAVVGAEAIVTKNIEPYAVVAGVPAKVLKYRV